MTARSDPLTTASPGRSRGDAVALTRPPAIAQAPRAGGGRSRTLGRFLVAGGVAYLVNQAMLFLLYDHAFAGLPRATPTPFGRLDEALLIASVFAVEVSILVRFLLNDRWTFRARCDRPFAQRLAQSNLGSFGSPLISIAAVNLLTPVLGISYFVSNSIGVALGLAWNWGWSTRVVWRRGPGAGA